MTSPGTRYTALVDKLKQHGHRITPQRAAILKVFTESQDHPSVEQVYEQIKADFPMTSLATIYKTVTLLKEEKEILELGFANESSRYDGNKPYPHPHLICVRCHRIIDPEIELFNELPQELAQKYGYQIVNQRVDFFGICPECQVNERRQTGEKV
ncbi:MAG: transcriptional repressor [Anaerolineaceae bacterium]|jgi:Fur family peroxide stress response transcriptional regulator